MAALDLARGPEAGGHDRQPGGGIGALGLFLVHRQRRGQHARMGIGNAHPFEDALNAAVLAPAPVQRIEGDIGLQRGETRAEIGAGIDLSNGITLFPQRFRAFMPGRQRHLALGGRATHQYRDMEGAPARRAHCLPLSRPVRSCPPTLRSWSFSTCCRFSALVSPLRVGPDASLDGRGSLGVPDASYFPF